MSPVELIDNVYRFLKCTSAEFKEARTKTDAEKREAVRISLQRLVTDFGTRGYGFNLAIERYSEQFHDSIQPYLDGILQEFMPEDPCGDPLQAESDLAFAAYYAISLCCKKENDLKRLEQLIDAHNEWTSIMNYPLAYEVLARYYKRTHDLPRALECDMQAIRFLKYSEEKKNCAVGISYASTVCRMYENGIDVTSTQWRLAREYIEDAIAFNPDYPKYYYLKGKLLYYSHRTERNIDVFENYCKEALDHIDNAMRLQSLQHGKHQSHSIAEYQKMIQDIESELERRQQQILPFQPMSPAELDAEIQKVLNSNTEDYCRPKNPNLKPGQKFVFISYSHADYKSVYCDLLQLYARNICFRYDALLSAGKNWEDEVHRYLCMEECVGVVFYISKNTPFSEPVRKECQLLKQQDESRFYFSVNLEKQSPTNILIQSIASYVNNPTSDKSITADRIVNFLQTFHDNITYIKKPPEDKADGIAHIPSLINELTKREPELQYVNVVPAPL